MTGHDRRLLRTAAIIKARAAAGRSQPPHLLLPLETWRTIGRLHRLRARAHQHGWSLAAQRLDRQLRLALQLLQKELATIQHQLELPSSALVQSVGDIYADLLSLDDEFSGVEIGQRAETISVTTEPIVLEDVDLGSFEIVLELWDLKYGRIPSYRINALSPQPAACNDRVTHPHVQDEHLCEGDGSLPIARALEQLRLLDFFVIVRGILETYNSDSPYVALSDWFGSECYDCAALIDPDDSSRCENCAVGLCDQCYRCCSDCSDVSCSECILVCEQCDENYCKRCLDQCTQCHEQTCAGCIADEALCQTCHDNQYQENQDETTHKAESTEIPTTLPAVHTLCVGQAAVPA